MFKGNPGRRGLCGFGFCGLFFVFIFFFFLIWEKTHGVFTRTEKIV